MDDALAVKAKWLGDSPDEDFPEPGPNAAAKVTIDYWQRQRRLDTGKQPSDAARWRMLEACLEDPRFYYGDLEYLPDTTLSHDRIKQFLDRYDHGDPIRPDCLLRGVFWGLSILGRH